VSGVAAEDQPSARSNCTQVNGDRALALGAAVAFGTTAMLLVQMTTSATSGPNALIAGPTFGT
jgi:hypothetical protein